MRFAAPRMRTHEGRGTRTGAADARGVYATAAEAAVDGKRTRAAVIVGPPFVDARSGAGGRVADARRGVKGARYFPSGLNGS